MNAYITRVEMDTLEVTAVDMPSAEILFKHGPLKYVEIAYEFGGIAILWFDRSEKMFTLLRLLGVKEEFQ